MNKFVILKDVVTPEPKAFVRSGNVWHPVAEYNELDGEHEGWIEYRMPGSTERKMAQPNNWEEANNLYFMIKNNTDDDIEKYLQMKEYILKVGRQPI